MLRCLASTPGQVPQFQGGLSGWHVCFQPWICPVRGSLCPAAIWWLVLFILKQEWGVDLLVSHLSSSESPLEFLETEKLPLQMSLLWICVLSPLKLADAALIQMICRKLRIFVCLFICFSSFLPSPTLFLPSKCLQWTVKTGSREILSSQCNGRTCHWGSPFRTCEGILENSLFLFFFFFLFFLRLLLVPFKKWICSVSSKRCCL